MATPKIKVYRLDRGYSSATDTDVQSTTNDELLPAVDKNLLPSDAYVLYGVTARSTPLIPLGLETVETLSNPGGQIQSGSLTNWVNDGYFMPVLRDNTSTIIPASDYVVDAAAGTVTFNAEPYPVDVQATYRIVNAAPSTTWYSPYYPFYGRANYNFAERLYHTAELYDNLLVPFDDYSIDYAKGMITTTVARAALRMNFHQLTDTANLFVSDHPNWIIGHTRTNPDVFVGSIDYPGDSPQGLIPKYVDSGFQVDYRNGTVEFATAINSATYPVRANFAYYSLVGNVTGQRLDYQGYSNGYVFKADTEKYWPDSHGKRWVTRDNIYMPNNIYDHNGDMLPKQTSTSPYSACVPSTLLTMAANETKAYSTDIKVKTYTAYVGSSGTSGALEVKDPGSNTVETIQVSNALGELRLNSISIPIGGVITYESVHSPQYYTFKVKYHGDLVFSIYDFVYNAS